MAQSRERAKTLTRGQTRMALMYLADNHKRVRYVPGLEWHVWSGTHWKPDDTGSPKRLAIQTVINARTEAAHMENPHERKELWADTKSCDNDAGLNGMLSIAKTLTGIATAPTQLDQDPYLFNCLNGTLDLRTGELLPHKREDLITKVAGCGYDPNATGITFLRFLSEILPDVEVRDYVQRLIGYSMLGLVKEHVLPLFIGPGRNGKSKLLEIVLKSFGDYGMMAAPTLLLERAANAATTDKVDLMGKRLVVCSETDEGNRFGAATVKSLTGGDTITARRMHKDFISFVPSHTVFMMTNHLPVTDGSDMAIFERIKKVTFDQKFIGPRQDPHLSEKLDVEREVVLRWAVEGYQKYVGRGLEEPQKVVKDTRKYQFDNDPLGRFISERCVEDNNAKVTSTALYDAWKNWNGGVVHDTQMAFSMKMESRGFEKKRSTGGRYAFKGIGLRQEEDGDAE
jgi:putative DNA primase/helicase